MSVLKLPGLVDVHVHLREPGGTHKEDWDSGTAAALAGGFTTVCAMPNTQPPIVSGDALDICEAAAREKARCDYGIYFGAGAENVGFAKDFAPRVVGLKFYLDQTFGPLRMDGLDALAAHMAAWPAWSPLLCHAEERTAAAAILAAQLAGRSVHICHVSKKSEIELIRAAKEKGIAVTCEVAPHHLFLCDEDLERLGSGRCEVRPRLATREDRDALRANLDVVDCFATDHAPHTLMEKDSAEAPPGYPGLETALPLYLQLVREDLITLDELVEKCATNPRRIFGLPEQVETWIEVDGEAEWTVRGSEMQTRAKWTPWEGATLRGRVERVVLRGRDAYKNGKIIAERGSGQNVKAEKEVCV